MADRTASERIEELERRVQRLEAGERFYPEPPKRHEFDPPWVGGLYCKQCGGQAADHIPKPAPERVGDVAKRVREMVFDLPPHPADLERLLAHAEASDGYEIAARGTAWRAEWAAWRRTVTGDAEASTGEG